MNQHDHWEFTLKEWSVFPFVEMLSYVKAGDIVFDVGANVGAWSKLALDRGAKVYAFEPQKDNYASLVQNVSCDAVNKGIFYGMDRLPAQNTTDSNCGAFTVVSTDRTAPTGEVFELTTLEKYPKANVIKLDVEGAEKNIIKNSIALKECPTIILEWHFDDDAEVFIKKYMKHSIVMNIENRMLLLCL